MKNLSINPAELREECINRICMQIKARERQHGVVTQAMKLPGDLQHRYKDSTRPPPCSTQDGATEGCSAVWDHSNKLLPQSGPAEASYTVY